MDCGAVGTHRHGQEQAHRHRACLMSPLCTCGAVAQVSTPGTQLCWHTRVTHGTEGSAPMGTRARCHGQCPHVCLQPHTHVCLRLAGKVVYAETTTAHATLTGLHYYHQDWFHAAAYVTVPPLRLDTNTSAYLMSLLAK